jgi:ABC-type amino acid transport substrate-binding protein
VVFQWRSEEPFRCQQVAVFAESEFHRVAGTPWSILNVGEGHFRSVIATRPDSPIRTVEDLKGKTIGTLLGDPYNALEIILRPALQLFGNGIQNHQYAPQHPERESHRR